MLYPFADTALARRYIEAQCAGWGALSRVALAVLPSIGEFFTLTPAPNGQIDLANGAIKPPSKPVAIPGGIAFRIQDDVPTLAQWIAAELRTHGGRAIVEHPVARPGDGFEEMAPVPLAYSELTVLLLIQQSMTEEAIAHAIGIGNFAFGHGMGI